MIYIYDNLNFQADWNTTIINKPSLSFLPLAGGTLTGNLTTTNITLGSNGKINSYDDYHYIQISQPTDTLTIQEYGKIIFSIGITKAEIGRINSSGLTITGSVSATSFSGSGSGITNLDYNNISLNKPTNFQSDWNTTIINKPSLSFLPLAGGTITGNLTVNGDLYL